MSYHTPTKPDQKWLDELLTKYTYDRESGQIRNIRINKALLNVNSNGYILVQLCINYKRKVLRAHHVVWFFEYGLWPKHSLDHIDGNKTNNHYSNLRECSQRENSQFFRLGNGTSKFMGVDFYKRSKKFVARIKNEVNQPRHLGYFTCEIEAARAYDKALVEMGLAPFNIKHYKDLMNKKETE